MKRKFTWSVLGAACLALSVNAAPRSAGDALKVARSFYEGKSLLRSVSESDFRLVYTGEDSDLRSSSNDPYYYIYNVGEDGGFVMVSGDDRVAPVIGYSLAGSFRPDDMPSNLKGWFEDYERQIDYARTLPERPYPSEVSALRSDEGMPDRVEPMVTAKWNQLAPYNDLCPMEGDQRTLTGCGATAMAQIMHYYQWPEKASGQGSYTIPALGPDTTIVNLEGITFDWANMTDTYDSASTVAQRKAVAELMVAAGASMNMMYGVAGSGAYNKDILGGFVRNMGYDKNASYISRSFYSGEKWQALLKSELALGRPVFYMAQAITGGHFFVCDGYDENDFFHINWGWGGYLDNYFKLDLLWEYNPASDVSGYSWVHSVVVGIQKPTDQSVKHREVRMLSFASAAEEIECGDTLSFVCKFQYLGCLPDEDLELSVELYKGDQLIRILDSGTLELSDNLDQYYYFQWIFPDFRLDPGTYDLKIRYRFEDDSEWAVMERSSDALFSDFRLVVTGTTIAWDYQVHFLSGQPVAMERIEDMWPYTWVAKTTVLNESDTETVESYLEVHISSSQLDTTFFAAGVSMAPGEERSLEIPLTIELASGEYQIELIHSDYTGDYQYVLDGTTSIFVVTDEATSIASPEDRPLSLRVSGDRLLIDSPDPIGEVRVYDRSGRLVASGTGSGISIPGLSSGVYYIRMNIGEEIKVRSLFIR